MHKVGHVGAIPEQPDAHTRVSNLPLQVLSLRAIAGDENDGARYLTLQEPGSVDEDVEPLLAVESSDREYQCGVRG